VGNRNAYRILVGKPEGKRPLGRHRRSGRIILHEVLGGRERERERENGKKVGR
jgi:hypothetical protein